MSTEKPQYTRPVVTDLGSVSAATLATISKKGSNGDVITIGSTSINVPGSSLV